MTEPELKGADVKGKLKYQPIFVSTSKPLFTINIYINHSWSLCFAFFHTHNASQIL